MKDETLEAFHQLIDVVAKLRDPQNGCPWDLEQTHSSLKPYVIEEAHEVVEAIDEGPDALKKELGDLLLQVLLHSQIAKDNSSFDIKEVITLITEKLIVRHPHVFGDTQAASSEQVLKNWEQIKQKDLKKNQSIMDGVPKAMPALIRAQRIGEKAARVGFEWSTNEDVRDKVFEEMREFLECCTEEKPDRHRMEDEFGDILFAISQLARRLKLNSEDLLNRSCNKFIRRFKEMERITKGKIKEHSLEELDEIWEQVKSKE